MIVTNVLLVCSLWYRDVASRNCVVDEDFTVKIGDYGYNIDLYKVSIGTVCSLYNDIVMQHVSEV